MTLLISGSRTITDRAFIFAVLDKIERPSSIVVGGAVGVDTIAEEWAVKNCVPVENFKKLSGNLKSLGMIPNNRSGSEYIKESWKHRDLSMCSGADQLLAFCKTSSNDLPAVSIMRKLNKPVAVVYVGGTPK